MLSLKIVIFPFTDNFKAAGRGRRYHHCNNIRSQGNTWLGQGWAVSRVSRSTHGNRCQLPKLHRSRLSTMLWMRMTRGQRAVEVHLRSQPRLRGCFCSEKRSSGHTTREQMRRYISTFMNFAFMFILDASYLELQFHWSHQEPHSRSSLYIIVPEAS